MTEANRITKKRRLVSKGELLERDPRSYVTIWKLMCEGKFPKSVELGEKSRGWWSDELDSYYEQLPRTKLKGDTQESNENLLPTVGQTDAAPAARQSLGSTGNDHISRQTADHTAISPSSCANTGETRGYEKNFGRRERKGSVK